MSEHDQMTSKEEIERRKKEIRNTMSCPHCGERLKKWAVPQTMFTTWPNEFMYICFNDECAYLVRSQESMARMGNTGTYRLMYDPLTDSCQPVPVLNKKALRDGIVGECVESQNVGEPCISTEDVSKEAIIGSWKLVSFERKGEDGSTSYPFGQEPAGILNYTEDGKVSVQNMNADGVMFQTPDGKVAALETHGAYNGRYELKSGGRIVHYVEVSLFPSWVGVRQERMIQVEGNRLLMVSSSLLVDGKTTTAYMTWERSR